ncbi:MAG: hypothetical protein K8U57_14030 [Planctomycetes bacterium]|nr:hypothetical protein [Planctomycetota bacterium]
MVRSAQLALVALLLGALPASAQFDTATMFEDVGELAITVSPTSAKRGEVVKVKFTVSPKVGAWTYPAKPKDDGQFSTNSFSLPKTGDVIFIPPVVDPPVKWELKPRDEKNPTGPQDQYFPGAVTWEFTAVVSPEAKPGNLRVAIGKQSRVQVCNKDNCFNARALPTAELTVLPGDPLPIPPEFKEAVDKALKPPPKDPPLTTPRTSPEVKPEVVPVPTPQHGTKDPKTLEQYRADLDVVVASLDKSAIAGLAAQEESVGAFVLTAVIWGLISLVTPCVFPMIPITVSIFLNHAHGSLRERIKLAGVYCLTIIIVLGLSAFALLKFMAWLSAHPITNVLLGGLFFVLALSLFGMYELTLPNFIVRRLQKKQSKGGVVGMIFGALAFTVISFTCVAPFLGGFAGISAANAANGSLIAVPTTKEILGGLAFATAFAAPFFVLAMVPGLLKALPRSGGWLDSVKVVMGFLELAAALKFFRTAELRVLSPAEFFTYDAVLAGWIAVTFACGLYLLNAYRLPHDEEKPNIGVPRLLFAVVFLGLGFYLLPALFKTADGKTQRPNGAVYAWVDAFLLPEPKDLGWSTDLPVAIAKVRSEGAKAGKIKPIVVDFTGVTCTNCKYNENTVFPQAKVNDLLDQFERVQLYCDEVPSNLFTTDPSKSARIDEARANDDFKFEVFRDQRLPLYAVFLPTADGKVKLLGKYDEGKINSPDKFAAWLKEMLTKK